MATKSKPSAPAPLVGAALGHVAHDAWFAARPTERATTWDQLDNDVAAAWCAAAAAVLTATYGRTTT